jgi:chromosome segregation ATPase
MEFYSQIDISSCRPANQVCRWANIADSREAHTKIRDIEQTITTFQSEVNENQRALDGLRKDNRVLTRTENEAKTSQAHCTNEAEELREALQQQKPDSGRVIAYQETIKVWALMTRLIHRKLRMKRQGIWSKSGRLRRSNLKRWKNTNPSKPLTKMQD